MKIPSLPEILDVAAIGGLIVIGSIIFKIRPKSFGIFHSPIINFHWIKYPFLKTLVNR